MTAKSSNVRVNVKEYVCLSLADCSGRTLRIYYGKGRLQVVRCECDSSDLLLPRVDG